MHSTPQLTEKEVASKKKLEMQKARHSNPFILSPYAHPVSPEQFAKPKRRVPKKKILTANRIHSATERSPTKILSKPNQEITNAEREHILSLASKVLVATEYVALPKNRQQSREIQTMTDEYFPSITSSRYLQDAPRAKSSYSDPGQLTLSREHINKLNSATQKNNEQCSTTDSDSTKIEQMRASSVGGNNKKAYVRQKPASYPSSLSSQNSRSTPQEPPLSNNFIVLKDKVEDLENFDDDFFDQELTQQNSTSDWFERQLTDTSQGRKQYADTSTQTIQNRGTQTTKQVLSQEDRYDEYLRETGPSKSLRVNSSTDFGTQSNEGIGTFSDTSIMANESVECKNTSIQTQCRNTSIQTQADFGPTVITYEVYVITGDKPGASTTLDIKVNIFGEQGNSGYRSLLKSKTSKVPFQRGQIDVFDLDCQFLGKLTNIRVGHNGTSASDGWYFEKIHIKPGPKATRAYTFICNKWLSAKDGDGQIMRDVNLSCESSIGELPPILPRKTLRHKELWEESELSEIMQPKLVNKSKVKKERRRSSKEHKHTANQERDCNNYVPSKSKESKQRVVTSTDSSDIEIEKIKRKLQKKAHHEKYLKSLKTNSKKTNTPPRSNKLKKDEIPVTDTSDSDIVNSDEENNIQVKANRNSRKSINDNLVASDVSSSEEDNTTRKISRKTIKNNSSSEIVSSPDENKVQDSRVHKKTRKSNSRRKKEVNIKTNDRMYSTKDSSSDVRKADAKKRSNDKNVKTKHCSSVDPSDASTDIISSDDNYEEEEKMRNEKLIKKSSSISDNTATHIDNTSSNKICEIDNFPAIKSIDKTSPKKHSEKHPLAKNANKKSTKTNQTKNSNKVGTLQEDPEINSMKDVTDTSKKDLVDTPKKLLVDTPKREYVDANLADKNLQIPDITDTTKMESCVEPVIIPQEAQQLEEMMQASADTFEQVITELSPQQSFDSPEELDAAADNNTEEEEEVDHLVKDTKKQVNPGKSYPCKLLLSKYILMNDCGGENEDDEDDESYMAGFRAGATANKIKHREMEEQEREEFNRKISGGPTIHQACESGNLDRLKELVGLMPELKSKVDERGWGPIHICAAFGHLDLLKWLSISGVNLTEETCTGYTPIHLAAMNGHVNCIMILAAMGCSTSCETVDKLTPLHAAAMSGHTECVKWLLSNRAKIGAIDLNGRTPLDLAEEYQREECGKLLRILSSELKRKDSGMSILTSSSNAPRRGSSSEGNMLGEYEMNEDGQCDDEHNVWVSDAEETGNRSTTPGSSGPGSGRRMSKQEERQENQLEEKKHNYETMRRKLERKSSSFLDSIRQDVEDNEEEF